MFEYFTQKDLLIYIWIRVNQIGKKVDKMTKRVLDAVQAQGVKISSGIDEVKKDLVALREALADTTSPEEVDAVLQPIVDRLAVIAAEEPPMV